mmetsp:Transcript_21650/g.50500  ORF Transcript_21650/g.50500 Transcript_21650/m.50500 type:complete len:610 (-) Transcript_21650:105-1934(-)
MIELGSAAFATLTKNASGFWHHHGIFNSPLAKRSDCKHIFGDVAVVIFDFDGTLTCTPGDRADRRTKIKELKSRAPMLAPWLRSLRDSGLVLGILSKSTTETVDAALRAAELRELFNGPVRGKAVGFEGKAGFIKEMCARGALEHLGHDGTGQVLLVDDDMQELIRAREAGIQTFPAPDSGGLQAEHFDEIFGGLKIALVGESDEVNQIWARGYIADALGLPAEPPKVTFAGERALRFREWYDIDEQARLGQGSFGYIRPGVHKRSGQRIAVKFVRRSGAGKLYIQTFVEGGMWTFLLNMSIEHSNTNVLKYYDFFTGPTILYTIMEELRGEDLLVYLRKHSPITEASSQSMVFQLLTALRHIHDVAGVGIIHRDVKLENMRFRTPACATLVLVDFGLCCSAAWDNKRKVVGTLPYMAPEVFSRDYTTKVDLWSAGVMLFIILSGKLPWQGNPFEHLKAPTLGASTLESALGACKELAAPSSAIDLLCSLLVIDPETRFTAGAALTHDWVVAGAASAIGSEDGPLLAAKHDKFSSPRDIKDDTSVGTGTSPFTRGSSARDICASLHASAGEPAEVPAEVSFVHTEEVDARWWSCCKCTKVTTTRGVFTA